MKTACQKFWGFSNSLDPNDNGRLNPEVGSNSSFKFRCYENFAAVKNPSLSTGKLFSKISGYSQLASNFSRE
jgi:hypothetical protein